MAKIIGIDLGTTNSVVCVMEGDEPVVIANQEGARTTPSVVSFDANGEAVAGQVAKRQSITNTEGTIFSAKRFIGRKFTECQNEVKRMPFSVREAKNGDCEFEIRGRRYAPPEISAKVLMKLKAAAEAYLGETVTEAVITVPAYFNDSQRQATRDAGRIAGLDVKRIINEPTAAALAYGLDKKKEETIAVYDFGGGTFDVSILEVGDGVVEVKSTNGDTTLGGDDVDHRLMDWLLEEFKRESGMDVSKEKQVLQRLKDAAEKAKIELSSVTETEINLPYLTADATGPKHLVKTLSRAKLEQLIDDIIERTMEPCRKAMADAGLKASDIHQVVLVGGSTRIPKVKQRVTEFFGREPHQRVNPDEVVALGAAVQAGVLSGDVKDLLLLDVTPLSLGIETLGSVTTVLIPRNTTIPTKRSETFSTASDSQSSVTVHVTQGERKMANDNKSLGKFNLDGIPSAPRGVPQIEVTFDIDANGIVHVSAKDKATGTEKQIRIESSSGISEADIQRMVREAEQNKEEDERKQEFVNLRNEVDSMSWSAKKLIDENREKLDAELVARVEEALAEAKTALESGSKETLEAAKSKLEKASHDLAQKMYEAASSEQGGGGGGNGGGADGDVIDAEFEDKK
ncbi:MAG: molecular chaperone DnaK [Deltaproteobacteria bacterium]|nr:molecular chaperone DnaK [Deltaproteobacteria bacterium]